MSYSDYEPFTGTDHYFIAWEAMDNADSVEAFTAWDIQSGEVVPDLISTTVKDKAKFCLLYPEWEFELHKICDYARKEGLWI